MPKPEYTPAQVNDLVLAASKALAIAPVYSGGRPDVARDLRVALEPFTPEARTLGAVPFYQQIQECYPEAALELLEYFLRVGGMLQAVQKARPDIDLSSTIWSFQYQAGFKKPGESLGVEPVVIGNNTLVLVWDSNDPDREPEIWAPNAMRSWTTVVLNKSEETGGRGDSTDVADIALLEAGQNSRYPTHIQL